MPTPAVSIAMTVHNTAAYLERAVRSVLAQSFRDLELVIHNDGSTDGSAAILDRLAQADPRVSVVHAPHAGVTPALAAVNQRCRAPLVGWVDSDDLLVASAVSRCVGFLASRPEVGMVYTDHVVIDEHDRLLGPGGRSRKPYTPEALLTDFMTFHFRLFRREVFDRVGGIDTSFVTSPDYDFCLRCSEATRIEHVPEVLYAYRLRGGSISQARTLEQIQSSRRAVENAMRRRGMDRTHELITHIRSSFTLVPKPPGMGPPPTR